MIVGRLAERTSIVAAEGEMARFGVDLERAYPETNTGKRFLVRSLKTALVGDVRAGLVISFAAAGLVLLITRANFASLRLARAAPREGEIAVRAALGASRGRLALQALLESALLAVAGGAAGVGLAFLGVEMFRRLAGDTVPRADQIGIDGAVLAIALLGIGLVTVLAGSAPALVASRPSLTGTLSQLVRGVVARGTVGFRCALLVGEVALSAGLLIGAGLLLGTFQKLQTVDVGFETREILRFGVVLPEANYPDIEQAVQFYAALESEIAALPGVEAVGAMFGPPLGRGHATGSVLVEGRPDPEDELEASVRSVTPGLLATLRSRCAGVAC